MNILVILISPCKTHLSTADHSATPIGNSADPYGRIDSQDTGMHVQQTTKFTKHDASTVMQLRSSWAVWKHGNLASTFQISIVRIFHQFFSILYQGRSWARLVWSPYQYRTIADIRVCRFPSFTKRMGTFLGQTDFCISRSSDAWNEGYWCYSLRALPTWLL